MTTDDIADVRQDDGKADDNVDATDSDHCHI